MLKCLCLAREQSFLISLYWIFNVTVYVGMYVCMYLLSISMLDSTCMCIDQGREVSCQVSRETLLLVVEDERDCRGCTLV